MKKLLSLMVLLSITYIQAWSQCDETNEEKILLVGDSWAFFMHADGTLNDCLKNYGHSNYSYYSNASLAINGARTEDFISAEKLAELGSVLDDKPAIEVVHLSIGGNDVLGEWNIDFTAGELEDLKAEVISNIMLIVDYLLEVKPNLRIVWSGYMYPNFEEIIADAAPFETAHPFYTTWEDMGFPSFIQINEVLTSFSDSMATLALLNPKMDYINSPALMQYYFGQEEPLGVAPGGTYPKDFQPLPYGDATYPSPKLSMRDYGLVRDCFHLSAEGFEVMMNYQMLYFYQKFLMHDFISFADDVETTGSISASGAILSDLNVGEVDGESYLTQLNFSLTSLADTVLQTASIFLRKDTSSAALPFSTVLPFRLTNDYFGTSTLLEEDDYMAEGVFEGDICVFGAADDEGDWLRIDLPEDALPYLLAGGNIQIIISQDESESGFITFSDVSNPLYQPVLNVTYKNTFVSLSEEKLEKRTNSSARLYPNPAINMIFLNEFNAVQYVDMINLKGQKVLSIKNPGSSVDVSSLPRGFYIVKIASEEGLETRKISIN
jgi:hypothetical protein